MSTATQGSRLQTERALAGVSAEHAPAPLARLSRTALAGCIAMLGVGTVSQIAGAVTPVGRCGDMVGKGGYTLRQAINNAPDGDTVDLSTLPVTCSTITLTGGEIAVTQTNLTVTAPIDRAISVDAAHAGRVFEHTGSGTLTVFGLNLVNGNGYGNIGSGKDGFGGCVRSAGSLLIQYGSLSSCTATTGGGAHTGGNLSLVHATISGCTAQYKVGLKTIGGAAYSMGALLASYSTIAANYSQIYTGGVYSKGAITINRTSVSGNTANFSTGVKKPASLFELYARCTAVAGGSTATLTGATIEGNLATHAANVAGARKAALCSANTLAVTSSTLSGNSGYAVSAWSAATLTNSTLSGNSAAVFFTGTRVSLFSSTLATNGTGVYGYVPFLEYCRLKAVSTIALDNGGGIPEFNLQGGCELYQSSNNLTGTTLSAAGVTPLGWHGGPTKTHALLSASTALNAGLNPQAESFDQRGIGFTRFAGIAPDIGAYERQADDDELFFGGFD